MQIISVYWINCYNPNRWYFRHQLHKIDLDALTKAKSISDKVDLNFGMGGFDLERHLAQMHRGDRRVAMMSESKLEDEQEAAAAAAAAAGPRRTGRAGAGRNDEYYANNPMVDADIDF